MVEGPVLVREAVEAGMHLVEQYVREDYNDYLAPVDTYELDEKTFRSVSDTESPRGIIAICEMSDPGPMTFNDQDWLVVLCEISDPGNMGTLIRSAEAAGARGVVTVGSTVDQWSPKVVRASAGAVFHVPIWSVQELETLSQQGVRLLGTTSHDSLSVSHPESMYDCDYSGLLAVVLGNEAHGLDPEAAVDEWVSIEHSGRSESLNVAMAGTVFAMHVAHCRRGNE